ncbi:hypothetical protein ZWY2020_040263 [Hordeum vulgare]|nr:hypothetical protein ZWY2020_040263 [Hordeum vulgare]
MAASSSHHARLLRSSGTRPNLALPHAPPPPAPPEPARPRGPSWPAGSGSEAIWRWRVCPSLGEDLVLYCSASPSTGRRQRSSSASRAALAAAEAPAACPAPLAFGATGSGILAVTLAVVRMYLGWAYVGNRTR